MVVLPLGSKLMVKFFFFPAWLKDSTPGLILTSNPGGGFACWKYLLKILPTFVTVTVPFVLKICRDGLVEIVSKDWFLGRLDFGVGLFHSCPAKVVYVVLIRCILDKTRIYCSLGEVVAIPPKQRLSPSCLRFLLSVTPTTWVFWYPQHKLSDSTCLGSYGLPILLWNCSKEMEYHDEK